MWSEVILLALTFLVLWLNFKRPSNYPPGYWGLPLVGYLPIFGKKTADEMLKELNMKHGNIASWRIGTVLFVFIFDYKLMKEAYGSIDFADRPNIKLLTFLEGDKSLGLMASNGVHWHNLRRFSLRHLRDLGMGKSRLVKVVQYEANKMIESLKKSDGKPAPVPASVMVTSLNVIWQMVASKRYDADDEELSRFQRHIELLISNVARNRIPNIFPWLSYVVPDFLMRKITRTESTKELSNKLSGLLKTCVDEHIATLDKNNSRDYIDSYLIEMDNQKENPSSTMSIEDLIYTMSDFHTNGSETTSATLRWTMYYLASFPEVQKKLHKEIDDVLPRGSEVTMEDKIRLPYTEAFIHEVLRYSALLSLGVIHTTARDTTLGGYFIPKGAFVYISSVACHNNPKYFEAPQEFRPERFLGSDGKFCNPKEGFVPFGVGRRQCVGESLARMELFIFIASLVQHLNFSVPLGKSLDLAPMEGDPFAHFPKEQNIIITSR